MSEEKKFTKEEIITLVTKLIVDKLNVDRIDITPDANFKSDLGADSLDTVELVMDFEKEFKISIPDELAEKIGSVGEAIDTLDNLLNNK